MIIRVLADWFAWRHALRELRQTQTREAWSLQLDENNPIFRAKMALAVDDHPSARRLWEEALARYPMYARTSHEALEVVLGLGLVDDAEKLAIENQKRRPHDEFYAGVFAEVAEVRRDYAEGIRRWRKVRRRFPGYWKGYVRGGVCLREIGELDASEALHRRAIERFPTVIHAWIEWARIAEARKDWLEAASRWESVYQEFNRHESGDIGIGRALMQLGRLDEAEERFRAGRTRCPIAVEFSIGLAQIAYDRGDKAEAARRWEETRRRFPLMSVGYESGVQVLREIGQQEEAEKVLVEAIDRFPREAWPSIQYATAAHERKNWPEAAKRWEAVRAAWPSRDEGYIGGAEALRALGREQEALELKRASFRP